MYFSEGLMLVKVEMRHNGDARTPRKYRTKSLSANMFVCDNTDKEAHRHGGSDERRLGGARKEEHSLCTNTLTLDRHMSIQFYVDDTVHKMFGGKGRRRKNDRMEKLVIRNALNSWSTIFDYSRARERVRLFRISQGETSVLSAS